MRVLIGVLTISNVILNVYKLNHRSMYTSTVSKRRGASMKSRYICELDHVPYVIDLFEFMTHCHIATTVYYSSVLPIA